VAGGLGSGTRTLYEALEQMLLLATDPSVKVGGLLYSQGGGGKGFALSCS
jgi:hypothetical protein